MKGDCIVSEEKLRVIYVKQQIGGASLATWKKHARSV